MVSGCQGLSSILRTSDTNATFFRERQNWRCSHCAVWGSAVWAVRDGPHGARVSFPSIFDSIFSPSVVNLADDSSRRSATTAVSSMSVTKNYRPGLKIFSCMRRRSGQGNSTRGLHLPLLSPLKNLYTFLYTLVSMEAFGLIS